MFERRGSHRLFSKFGSVPARLRTTVPRTASIGPDRQGPAQQGTLIALYGQAPAERVARRGAAAVWCCYLHPLPV